jgi:hypothetical protein
MLFAFFIAQGTLVSYSSVRPETKSQVKIFKEKENKSTPQIKKSFKIFVLPKETLFVEPASGQTSLCQLTNRYTFPLCHSADPARAPPLYLS